MATSSEFIRTLDDDDGELLQKDSDDEDEKEFAGFSKGFVFDVEQAPVVPWNFDKARSGALKDEGKKSNKETTIDAKIQTVKNRKTFEKGESSEEDEAQSIEDMDDDEEIDLEAGTRAVTGLKPKKQKQSDYFAEAPVMTPVDSFEELHISRPVLKAISELGWAEPTPVQKQVVPIALSGKDIAGSAVTGSGKTAAFVLPILERLLFRDTRIALTRALILTPTRELACQCCSVIENLAKYTNNIRVSLILGGLPLSPQIVELRSRPDIIVATPGRLIDHLMNTQSFGLEDLEILVLDEADRLLELGFIDEIEKIISLLPRNRQGMLFSATMTEKVSQLEKLSLNHPVRITVDPMFQTSKKLAQEFVRIRLTRENERQAYLLALCTRTFKTKTIIFFQEKKQAHHMKVLFGIAGLKAAELHGNLTQVQRLDALELFRDGKVDYLLATDLASRGLDILGIHTVINYTMPNTEAIYIHRVGRTARAGRNGRSVTLIGDSTTDRKMLKEIVKKSDKSSCKHRLIPADAIQQAMEKIKKFSLDMAEVDQLEKEERLVVQAVREAEKAENMLLHEEEIHSRPPRTWFQSNREKELVKKASKAQSDAGDEEVAVKALKPRVKRQPNRQERKKQDDKELSHKAYQLAKKKNQKLAPINSKRKRESKRDSSKRPSKKPKTDSDKPAFLPTGRKSSKGKGQFKSKNKHKRRK